MAKSCCICGSSIGVFEKPKPLAEGRDDLPVCESCIDVVHDAKAQNIDPANTSAIQYHNKAVKTIADGIARGEIAGDAKSILEEIPDIAAMLSSAEELVAKEAEIERRYKEERNNIIQTTGFTIEGYRIAEYHKIVSADAVIGTGPIASTAAAIMDTIGEQSESLSKKIAIAKESAAAEMLKKAIYAGGNAVIGVSYNVYVVATMLGASVTGTSVTIEKE